MQNIHIRSIQSIAIIKNKSQENKSLFCFYQNPTYDYRSDYQEQSAGDLWRVKPGEKRNCIRVCVVTEQRTWKIADD